MSMRLARPAHFSKPSPRRARIRLRVLVALLALTIPFVSTKDAFAQFSQDFDLACRTIMTAGGSVIRGGSFAVNGALGLPMVPPADSGTAPTYAVRSTNYGVRAGFLPGYPNGDGPAVTPPVIVNKNFVQRLPLLFKVAYIVRGC